MLVNVIIITAGAMLMMWLGEIINEKGIGNGISLIIFSGIVATLPSSLLSTFKTLDMSQAPIYIALAITFVIVLMGIVAVTEAERPIEVTYAKQSRGYASTGMSTTYIPMRLTMAGVVPVIFAVSLLTLPQLLAQLLSTSQSAFALLISGKIIGILNNQWIYGAIYFGLIVMFTFFYTAVTFDPIKTAENLQKGGAFIPGHRPGEATTNYMSDVLTRVTTVGAIFLGLVALLPIILSGLTGTTAISVGGTSLLIAVSVVIDLLKKIDAQLTMREY
jgi:preprotein translocase subunit SecY